LSKLNISALRFTAGRALGSGVLERLSLWESSREAGERAFSHCFVGRHIFLKKSES
jgi:hypothetical protein